MRDIEWQPLSTAKRDGTAILAYIPKSSSNLQTRGIYTMHWSGWGGGVWETGGGWRPMEWDLEGALWTSLEIVALSGQQASKALPTPG